MKFKKTGAEKSTITREINDLTEKTGNIYKAVSILANRSKQINEKMKEELLTKLEEFVYIFYFMPILIIVISFILIKYETFSFLNFRKVINGL